MKSSLTLFSFLAIWLLSGCDKPRLTPITQEGKNTFSCKVNGKVWVPERHAGGLFGFNTPAISGGYRKIYQTDTIGIFISARTNSRGRIRIFLEDIQVGVHLLNIATTVIDTAGIPRSYATYEYPTIDFRYMTNPIHTGIVNITKSDYRRSGIISGTFEFTAADQNGNVVHITDGRFDIKSPL